MSTTPSLVIDTQSLELRIVEANPAYLTASNNTYISTVVGISFSELVANKIPIKNEDKILLLASLQQALKTGRKHQLVINNYFYNHTPSTYTVTHQPIENNLGEVFFIVETVTLNIIEGKEYLLLETMSDGFFSLSKDFTVLYINSEAEKIWNISRNEIIGKNLWAHFDLEAYANIYQFYIDAFNTNSAKYLEIFSEKKQHWYEISAYPFNDGLSVYFKDISERKKAIEREALLASIISSSDDGIISKTLDGIITSWNKGAEGIFGYFENEAIGKSIGIIIPKELFAAEEHNIVSQIKNGDHVKHYETIRENKSGQRIDVSLTVSPIRNAEGVIVGASKIVRNITDKKRTEFRLKEQNLALTQSSLELEAANKNLQTKAMALAASNAELEQFAYVASHDLQEPLRMISSFLTQLNNKYEDILDERAKKYISFAVDGAKRMRQIVLDLLEFSRVGRIENLIEEVNITALIDSIQVLFSKDIEEKKAAIIYNNLPTITGYTVSLRQIFQNLISNALKYCKLEVAPIVTITAIDFGAHWQFSVTDNGIGIEEEYFDKIFIIFQRLHTKDQYPGTGMGLAITKKIIENMGSRIWLTSIENEGSTFYFTIPK